MSQKYVSLDEREPKKSLKNYMLKRNQHEDNRLVPMSPTINRILQKHEAMKSKPPPHYNLSEYLQLLQEEEASSARSRKPILELKKNQEPPNAKLEEKRVPDKYESTINSTVELIPSHNNRGYGSPKEGPIKTVSTLHRDCNQHNSRKRDTEPRDNPGAVEGEQETTAKKLKTPSQVLLSKSQERLNHYDHFKPSPQRAPPSSQTEVVMVKTSSFLERRGSEEENGQNLK
jgi:hypothetical protein